MDIKCPHCKSYLNIREVVSNCTECKELLFNNITNCSKKERWVSCSKFMNISATKTLCYDNQDTKTIRE